MGLLSKKSWNPTNSKNRERVRRDKEKLIQQENNNKFQCSQRESELRYRQLKRKKCSGEQEHLEESVTTARLSTIKRNQGSSVDNTHEHHSQSTFGDSVKEPWYATNRTSTQSSATSERKKRRDDPQNAFAELESQGNTQENTSSKIRGLSQIEQLRLERYRREKTERERTENLLKANHLMYNKEANERYTNRFKRD